MKTVGPLLSLLWMAVLGTGCCQGPPPPQEADCSSKLGYGPGSQACCGNFVFGAIHHICCTDPNTGIWCQKPHLLHGSKHRYRGRVLLTVLPIAAIDIVIFIIFLIIITIVKTTSNIVVVINTWSSSSPSRLPCSFMVAVSEFLPALSVLNDLACSEFSFALPGLSDSNN